MIFHFINMFSILSAVIKRKENIFLFQNFKKEAREYLREKFPDIPEDKDPLKEVVEVFLGSVVMLGGLDFLYILFAFLP